VVTDRGLGPAERFEEITGAHLAGGRNHAEQSEPDWIGQRGEPPREQLRFILGERGGEHLPAACLGLVRRGGGRGSHPEPPANRLTIVDAFAIVDASTVINVSGGWRCLECNWP